MTAAVERTAEGWTVSCDGAAARDLLAALRGGGWAIDIEEALSSPINSFWRVTARRDGIVLRFDGDDWFCTVLVPEAADAALLARVAALPR